MKTFIKTHWDSSRLRSTPKAAKQVVDIAVIWRYASSPGNNVRARMPSTTIEPHRDAGWQHNPRDRRSCRFPSSPSPMMPTNSIPRSGDAVLTSAWAAKRWNLRALEVPGLAAAPGDWPGLTQRRALAIASLLRGEGVETVAAPNAGRRFSLHPAIRQ